MKVKGLTHVGVIVKNLEKTIEFYTTVLGLELVDGPSDVFMDPEEGIGMGIEGDNSEHAHREAILRIPDGNTIELIEFTVPEPVNVPLTAACVGKLHMGFLVDDIEEWVKRLAEYDVKPFMAPKEFETGDEKKPIGYWMYMRDPDGIIFELQQM
ncbi:MAG: VOC family protein [Anaerovoracaceae bacterium]